MIYGRRYKFIDSVDLTEEKAVETALKSFRDYAKKQRKKGFVIFYINHNVGLDGDDFVRCLKTIIIYFNKYKKPRFIK